MCSAVIDWLSATVPEFGALSEDEKAAIQNFTLLWGFFEARCLDNNAGMPQIRTYVQNLPDEVIAGLQLDELAEYFKARYMEAGDYSYRYHHLHLDRSGNPEEVEEMLRGTSQSARDLLIGCLGIIYRYRNNLFHGEKWRYGLQEQKENFERSSQLIIGLMSHGT